MLGTCLPVNTIRRVLRKVEFPGLDRATDYQIHCTGVDFVHKGGLVAKLLDKELERTYRKNWKVYRRLRGVQEVREQWRKDFEAGHIAGAFWAVLHHPSTDANLIRESFGSIHMLSHHVIRCDLKKIQGYDAVRRQLANADRKQQETERAHRKTVERLEAQLQEQEQRLEKNATEISRWEERLKNGDAKYREALEADNERCRRMLARSERHLQHARETIKKLRELELADVSIPAQHARETMKKLREVEPAGGSTPVPVPAMVCRYDKSTSSELDECLQQISWVAECNSCDLKGRIVLYVGGEKGLVPHLRRLTQQANGQFLHHDGGVEDSIRSLPRMCARADVVLCPVNKVGHNAIGCVKRSCSDTAKPFVPLRRASLDAFSKGISGLGEV